MRKAVGWSGAVTISFYVALGEFKQRAVTVCCIHLVAALLETVRRVSKAARGQDSKGV